MGKTLTSHRQMVLVSTGVYWCILGVVGSRVLPGRSGEVHPSELSSRRSAEAWWTPQTCGRIREPLLLMGLGGSGGQGGGTGRSSDYSPPNSDGSVTGT